MVKMSDQKCRYKEMSMRGISESEKKRLESLQRQKETFKAKELAVQNALKNLDNKSNNNKIIFDEDIDVVKQPEFKKKREKRKRNLFDNGDDDKDNGESLWDIDKFETERNVAGKPYGRNLTLGNDERFKIDERFMDDNHISDENVTVENNDESNLLKEKQQQLDILGNILGVPIAPKNVSNNKEVNKDFKFPKKEMIRYDPTESNHKEYEITTEKREGDTKKIKTKKKTKEVAEDDVSGLDVEVSKDVYFSVSDSLSKSLKESAQFSLLKKYGKEEYDEKEDNNYNAIAIQPVTRKFQFNFDAKNPFKYDSSDDETDRKELKTDNKEEHIENEQSTNDIIKDTTNFFFNAKDARFNEAVKFFSKECMPDDDFKTLRRELKLLVRSKVRQNVKKNQPWGHKKKIKRAT